MFMYDVKVRLLLRTCTIIRRIHYTGTIPATENKLIYECLSLVEINILKDKAFSAGELFQ